MKNISSKKRYRADLTPTLRLAEFKDSSSSSSSDSSIDKASKVEPERYEQFSNQQKPRGLTLH